MHDRRCNNTHFQIINYNCHPLRFLKEVKDVAWDIVVFTETWRPDLEECWRTKWGHTWYGSGGSKGSKGVGIFLHRRWRGLQFERSDNRICKLDVSVAGLSVCVVAVYMPHGNYSDGEVDAVYECLDHIVADGRSKSRYLLLAGDFNCQSGAWELGDDPDVIGEYGLQPRNSRGRTLVDWCTFHNLCVANTFTEQSCDELWTYSHSGCRKVLDYFLLDRALCLRSTIFQTHVLSDVDIGSDHRPQLLKISLQSFEPGESRQQDNDHSDSMRT